MSTTQPSPIVRLFRVCEPNVSLYPDDPRYVDFDAVRGDGVIQVYARSLRRADPAQPEVKLLAGHMGSGKTSELYRLQAELEKETPDSRPFLVLYLDVTEKLDANDLDFPDLLVFLAAELQRELRAAEIPEFSATSEWLGRLWDEFRSAVQGSVKISGAEANVPFGSVALEFRNRPTSRGELRRAIEAQSTPLLAAVNDLLDLAQAAVRKAGKEGVVLLVDGLDKMVRRPLDDGTSNTHDRLFLDRREQLASLRAHVVYTVPINVLYSARCAQLEQAFGEHNLMIPMIRLRGDSRSEIAPGNPGVAKMVEMLERRCQAAKVDFTAAFAEDVPAYLVAMSGGHPRHLMMFVQSALNELDGLPISRDAAAKAVQKYGNSLRRSVSDRAWERLGSFATPQSDIPKDDLHQEMLYNLWVFEYMNGEPWWEVNPVLRTLDRFRAAS